MKKTKIKIISLCILMLGGILRVNSQVIVFDYTYGNGSTQDYVGECVQQTSDGGYVVAGTSYQDIFVKKTNNYGAIQWIKTYAKSSNTDDAGYYVQQTTDGGYIVSGITLASSSNYDVYLLKITSNGSLTWSKTYGGTDTERGYYVKQTADGGYAIIGQSTGSFNTFIIKTNSAGALSWFKKYDVAFKENYTYQGVQTSDGGFICTGYLTNGSYSSVYLLKTTSDGNVQWTKSYGGTNEGGKSVQQTTDGGYIISGQTYNYGVGIGDTYVIKTGSDGSLQWNKTYGKSNYTEFGNSIFQCNDGGYLITGDPVIKINSSGTVTWSRSLGSYNSNSIKGTNDGGYVLTDYKNFSNHQTTLIKSYSTNNPIGCVSDYTLTTTTPSPTVLTLTTTATTFTNTATPTTTVNSGSATTVSNCSACPANAGADRTIACNGSSTLGTSSSGYTWSWAPSTYLSCTTCAQPVAHRCGGSSDVVITYTLTTSGGSCITSSDQVTVTYDGFPLCICNDGPEPERFANSDPNTDHNNGVIIYPNPSDGKIIIETSSAIESIAITDITGRVVYKEKDIVANYTQVDLSKQPKGIYLIKVIQNGKEHIQKIALE